LPPPQDGPDTEGPDAGVSRTYSDAEADEWGGEWLARYEGTDYWTDRQHPRSALEE
jgi:hypothetical protein